MNTNSFNPSMASRPRAMHMSLRVLSLIITLSSVLQKLQEDQARALVIAPLWRTQVWFPQMCQMLISQPVPLPKEASLLQLPHDRTKQHPLWSKLQRMACLLSGRDSDNKHFSESLGHHHGIMEDWHHHTEQSVFG